MYSRSLANSFLVSLEEKASINRNVFRDIFSFAGTFTGMVVIVESVPSAASLCRLCA